MMRDVNTAFLENLYDQIARKMPVNLENKEAFDEWKNTAIEKLKMILGIPELQSLPLEPLVFEQLPLKDGLIRERFILRTEKEVWMPCFLIRDSRKEGKKPAVVLPPYNGSGKFGVIDSSDYGFFMRANQEKKDFYQSHWDFASSLARAGYLVVSPDLRGTGERREWMDSGEETFERSSKRPVNNVAIALGQSLLGINVWEIRCLCDYLESRDDYNGMVSIGGEQEAAVTSLYSAAVTGRFSKCFMINGFNGFRNGALTVAVNSSATYAPSLMLYFDMCDIAAMTCPTELYVQTTPGDLLNGEDDNNVLKQAEETEKAFVLAGAASKFRYNATNGTMEAAYQNICAFMK